jgi:hypothetical protein
MATQATGEQVTGRKRGRPSKAEKLASLKASAPALRGEKGSDFERLVKAHSGDTIVKAFASLRKKLFKAGEPVDQMTNQLTRRLSDLQSKTNIVH